MLLTCLLLLGALSSKAQLYYTGTDSFQLCNFASPWDLYSNLEVYDDDHSGKHTVLWTVTSSSLHGTLTGFPGSRYEAGGTMQTDVHYTPDSNYAGKDSFTIKISSDGVGASTLYVTIHVNVHGTPTIDITDGSATICAGGSVSFSPAVTDVTRYVWYYIPQGGYYFTPLSNGGIYSGTQTGTLQITSASASDNNTPYYLKVIGLCGIIESGIYTLHISAPYLTLSSSSPTVCTNGSVDLFANNVQGINSVVKWYTIAGGGGVLIGTGNTITTTLGPKTYHAVVTDSCGSMYEDSITIGQQLTATFSTDDVTCFGKATGSIHDIVVSGGFAPYLVSTKPATGFVNTDRFDNLKAAPYRIYIQDVSGCTGYTDIITIHQPDKITTTFTASFAPCYGVAGGPVDVTSTTGGTPGTVATGYEYSLSSTGPFKTATSFLVKAGTYRLYTKDAAGCTVFTTPFTVYQPNKVVTTFTKNDVTCRGGNDGILYNLSTAGGIAGAAYSLSASGPFNAVSSFPALKAGTVRIYTQDGAGCTVFTDKIVIAQPDSIKVTYNVVRTCGTTTYGDINITGTSGGSGSGYTYSLKATGPFTNTPAFPHLKSGSYRVYVIDGKGCSSYTQLITIAPCIITRMAPPSANETQEVTMLTAYPNPSNGQFALKAGKDMTGKTIITIVNEAGTTVATKQVNITAAQSPVAIDLSRYPSGLYMVRMQSNKKIETTRVVIRTP